MADWSTWQLITASIATALGTGWLALAMPTHWQQVHIGDHPSHSSLRIKLRTLGGTALLVSLWLCMQADHPSMAALVWLMLLAASSVSIAMILAWQPKLLRILWP